MSDAEALQLISASPGATETAGRELAERLAPGDLVVLEGDLAAGKTTFVRGLVEGLGGDADQVTSPTFVLVQPYPTARGRITLLYHVDLYRLDDDPVALRELGLEELLSDASAVLAVEWPKQTLTRWLPAGAHTWRVTIVAGEDQQRTITVEVVESRGYRAPRRS